MWELCILTKCSNLYFSLQIKSCVKLAHTTIVEPTFLPVSLKIVLFHFHCCISATDILEGYHGRVSLLLQEIVLLGLFLCKQRIQSRKPPQSPPVYQPFPQSIPLTTLFYIYLALERGMLYPRAWMHYVIINLKYQVMTWQTIQQPSQELWGLSSHFYHLTLLIWHEMKVTTGDWVSTP